jgi:putative endonuclease
VTGTDKEGRMGETAPSARLGQWGQDRAESFLKSRGMRLLSRNFSCGSGEIDLVMVDADGSLVFVEVKTRTREVFADAEAAVTPVKNLRLGRAVRFFLAKHRLGQRPFRMDVVVVVPGRRKTTRIRHYMDTFSP